MLAMLLLNRISAKRRVVQTVQKPRIKCVKTEKNLNQEHCRTCLGTEDLVSIFYNKANVQKRSEHLRLVTGLEITMNDGLSQKICRSCLETMNVALQFRRTSKKAEKSLKEMLNGTNPKKKISKVVRATKKSKTSAKSYNETEYSDQNLEIDYSFEYNLYGEDFQNDYDCEVKKEPKTKVKQKPAPAATVKRKRMALPPGGPYKCITCNKEFRMKATYKAHMRFHTNFCVCESCGKRCRNNNQLQEHKRARHGLGRIHKCAYCEYSSATKEALTIHERRHTGERPYICDHCGATFHRRSNLVQHIAIHLPEKNFQCSVCPKREKSRKLLAIHEYKYHRENRYRYLCPVCHDTFTRPGNVRQHLARSHGVAREHQGVIERVEVAVDVVPEEILS